MWSSRLFRKSVLRHACKSRNSGNSILNDNTQYQRAIYSYLSSSGSQQNGSIHMASDSSAVRNLLVASGLMVCASSAIFYGEDSILSNTKITTTQLEEANANDDDEDENTTILNWSGTHSVVVKNKNYWEPETIEEIEGIVKQCHENGQPVRPIGSALSPNGIAFNNEGMISMANLDNIIEVDTQNNTVTVQAGARVSQVVDALREYNLTLPNLASIAEQQMGGFVQVGAHGTGRTIAPVDHYVTKIKLVTPSHGTIELTEEKDGELFHLAKVGLGCLGVVVEVTMSCIPAHKLVEHTFVLTRQQAKEQKDELLKKHKHMRYMWIPYEDAVVVVTNDPEDSIPDDIPRDHMTIPNQKERFEPLTDLLKQLSAEKDVPEPVHTDETLEGMGFGELRDALLSYDPIGADHIKLVNKAEAEFWRRSEGYQTKPSDQLLQFDCGGQQWVWEVCFPTGTQEENNGNDMEFLDRLLLKIEDLGIPAPAPIEQRWTAASSSLMSPANYGPPDGLHCWVGIINYLPSEENERQRRDITELFLKKYCRVMRAIGTDFNITSHWAKLERPKTVWELLDLRLMMEGRFPTQKFLQARKIFDPKGILGNPLMNLVLGDPKSD